MFRLEQSGPGRGDATAPYKVILNKEYTVKEFIDAVLSNNRERGHIGIKSKEEPFFGCPVCEYSNGKLTTSPMPIDIMDRKIKSATASGGWGLMDYLLILERKSMKKNVR